MAKLVASLAALFLYGSLGAASGIQATPAKAGACHEQVRATNGASNSALVAPKGKMSAEERERREAVCQRTYETDMDWCWTTTKNIRNKEKRDREGAVCREKAAQKMAECQARIDG